MAKKTVLMDGYSPFHKGSLNVMNEALREPISSNRFGLKHAHYQAGSTLALVWKLSKDTVCSQWHEMLLTPTTNRGLISSQQ